MGVPEDQRGKTRDAIRAFQDSVDREEDSRMSVVVQMPPTPPDSTPPLVRATARGVYRHWRTLLAVLALTGVGWLTRVHRWVAEHMP